MIAPDPPVLQAPASSTSTATPGTRAIPYQTGGTDFVSSVTSTLLMTVLLLAVLLGALLAARRVGWLRRWIGPKEQDAGPSGLRVLQRIRLSPATRLYVVGREKSAYLVVESSQRVEIRPYTEDKEDGHAG